VEEWRRRRRGGRGAEQFELGDLMCVLNFQRETDCEEGTRLFMYLAGATSNLNEEGRSLTNNRLLPRSGALSDTSVDSAVAGGGASRQYTVPNEY